MGDGENLFAAARKASGITQEEAANICDVAVSTYRQRERRPLDFRLGELVALSRHYGKGARSILSNAVGSLFLA